MRILGGCGVTVKLAIALLASCPPIICAPGVPCEAIALEQAAEWVGRPASHAHQPGQPAFRPEQLEYG